MVRIKNMVVSDDKQNKFILLAFILPMKCVLSLGNLPALHYGFNFAQGGFPGLKREYNRSLKAPLPNLAGS